MNQTIKDRIAKINNGQVPEGYEKTSFGIFPCDWENKKLGELAYLSKDKFDPDKSQNNPICIELEHLSTETGQIIGHTYGKYQNSIKNSFSMGNILFGKLRPYLRKFYLADFNGVCSTEIWVIKSKEHICNEFLYKLISSELFIKRANESSFGTKMPRADWKKIEVEEYILPKTEQEQSRIAQILMQWDKTIELQEKYIASLENRKKALMQRLLTPKEGWKKVELGEICDIRTGNKNTQDKVDNGKYPFYVRSATVERINTYSFDGEAILIPGDGNIGDICHYINAKFDYHQRVYKVSSNDKTVSVKYLYYFLQKNLKKRVIALSAKATVDSIRLDMLTEMEIYIPDIYEKISNTLSQADQEISLQKEKLQNLIAQRKALMQVLLTGIVRV